jgi:hypothetical protein
MINTKLQNIIDTKSAIGNAIVNKGGTITSETPFFNYAAQIDGISTGTPQTIFLASDGSKWALTNVVNLTNVSNNVTHDFNYWQPANNSTSDPILNIGTVGANISGNIQLVQVNQVNISQYVNIVATDTDGAKYEGFNGYDSVTNPTPTGNATFNRWLLNNSATGTVIFANATIVNGGIFNGPNVTFNQSNLAFINNTNIVGGQIESVTTNNGFIYTSGASNNTLQKFYESNLAFVGNTNSLGDIVRSITTNNGFIYAGTFNNVKKYHESNLVFVGNTNNSGAIMRSITTNDGFIYAGGDGNATANRDVKKYYESNLAFVGNTAAYGGTIYSITTNNGFIYAGGVTNQRVQKFFESNLSRATETNVSDSYNGSIYAVATNNGFVYAAGGGSRNIKKYYESNLTFVGNTVGYDGDIITITINNGFIYAAGELGGYANGLVRKYYESNLVIFSNTVNYGGFIYSITTNNNFIYVGGGSNQTVQKFQEAQIIPESETFYTATKIKE